MPYRTYDEQQQWGIDTLAKFEAKVVELGLTVAAGKQPSPALQEEVNTLRAALIEGLKH